ncbi:MAG TPA: glycoside hydrolase family 76 protein [Prolixibacteraceae bacterium]
MKNALRLIPIAIFCLCTVTGNTQNSGYLSRAEETLGKIKHFYQSGQAGLFNENYPNDAKAEVTYLVNQDTSVRRKVAYLWPTSGVFSGVNALLKITKDKKYAIFINDTIIPGIGKYFDNTRAPFCYQSYITATGHADRYYDDNVWLGIDFLESYHLTGNRDYLDKSIETWQFIISGWTEEQGGGIFWCEQKKGSKNTCSNAPSAVLALQLFETTKDKSYFDWGEKIYRWTKTTLQDTTDNLYFDNISLSGKISKAKYTYNSGQMLQAAALLYKITGKEIYLTDARKIAKSAIQYFSEDFFTPEGKKIRLFKNRGNWFNAILVRGYKELNALDKNDEYLKIFRDNLDYVWDHVRDEKGLFVKNWSGEDKATPRRWLLDQAAMVELYATLGN